MSRHAEDREMDDVMSVRNMQGQQEHVSKRTPMTGNSLPMLQPLSISPHLMYSLYDTQIASATTGASHVARGWSQLRTATLHNEVEDICTYLTAATVPLMTRIEQASQSVQQTIADMRFRVFSNGICVRMVGNP